MTKAKNPCVYCGKGDAKQIQPDGSRAHLLCIPLEVRQQAISEKRCGACKAALPVAEFYANKTAADGYHNYCKSCQNGRERKKYTPTQVTYYAMRERCRDGHLPKFRNYGGKGVKLCERWSGRQGFRNFLADMGERPEGMSIDRIDSAGDYCPENCRWATIIEQARNKSNVGRVAFGKKQTLPEWAAEYGISEATLHTRLRMGWTFEDALTRPIQTKKPRAIP